MKPAPTDKEGRLRFPGVRPPKALLSAQRERGLSRRQVDLLDALEEQIVRGGVGHLTMAEIAARANCSLRTLYGIAASKDELLLAIIDRRLHRIGRAAIEGLDPSMSPMDALRAYLTATNEAVQPETLAMSADLVKLAGAQHLIGAHEAYLTAIARSLLERAVAEGQIAPVDTAAVAHILGGLGREFAQADVAEVALASPKDTADAVTELILQGLLANPGRP